MTRPVRLCEKHGGTVDKADAFWCCDVCSTKGINKCECGGAARYFGEAMMCSISCPDCDNSLMTIGSKYDIYEMWNDGMTGVYNEYEQ